MSFRVSEKVEYKEIILTCWRFYLETDGFSCK